MDLDSTNGTCEAPALARGIALLRLLNRDGALTLERIARATRWPKPSLLRLLHTLAAEGATARDAATGRWRATVRLASVETGELRLVERCAPAVARLCRDAGHVVEVYAWEEGRLVMVDRADPPHGEVVVRRRLGVVCDESEIDAVSLWALAVGGARRPRRPWEWAAGEQAPLDRARLDALLARSSADGVACDRGPNPRQVRRFAAPVLGDGGRLCGVIALACAPMPPPSASDERFLRAVLSAAKTASGSAA